MPGGDRIEDVCQLQSTIDDFESRVTSLEGATVSIPAGIFLPYGGANAPSGWLLCDGAAVSRTTYAALFAAIGTAYGAGNGSTTFNVPDMRSRVPVGFDSGAGEFDALGETGGAKTHQLSSAEMPSHTHVQNAHNHGVTDPGHNHTQNAHNHGVTDPGHNHTQNAHNHAVTDPGHTHPYKSQTAATGSATSYEHGAIDTSSTEAAEGESTDSAVTGLTVNNATAVNQSNTTGVTVNNATPTNNAAATGVTVDNATPTNQNTGGGAFHNNLQPYNTANYIIKT